MRHDATPAEKKLWAALRVPTAVLGFKFRRQQALHPFIVDFACMAVRLVIEIDGPSHDTAQNYDKARTEFLQRDGYSVLRFSNEDMIKNTEGVVLTILQQAEDLLRKNKDST